MSLNLFPNLNFDKNLLKFLSLFFFLPFSCEGALPPTKNIESANYMGSPQHLELAGSVSAEYVDEQSINTFQDPVLTLAPTDGNVEFADKRSNTNEEFEKNLKDNFMLIKLSEDIYNLSLLHALCKSSSRRDLLHERPSFSYKEEVDLYISTGIISTAQILCLGVMFNWLIEDTLSGAVTEHALISCDNDISFSGCEVRGNIDLSTAGVEVSVGKALSMFVAYTIAWSFLRPNVLQISRLSLIGGDLVQTERNKCKLFSKIFGITAVGVSQSFIVTTTFWLMSNIAFRSDPLIDTMLQGIGLVILNEIDDIACYSFFQGGRSFESDNLFTYRSSKKQLSKLLFKNSEHLQIHDMAASYSLFLMMMGRWVGYTFFGGQGDILNPIFNISTILSMCVIFIPPFIHAGMAFRQRYKFGLDSQD